MDLAISMDALRFLVRDRDANASDVTCRAGSRRHRKRAFAGGAH
jgi:hypothetical protein